MAAPSPGDPRRGREAGARDARPAVGRMGGGVPIWVIAGGVAFAAILLFIVLESRRQSASAPPVRSQRDSATSAAAFPPLVIPQSSGVPLPVSTPLPTPVPTPTPVATPTPTTTPQPAPTIPAPPQIVYVPQPAPPASAVPAIPPPRISSDPVLVIDTGSGATAIAASADAAGATSDLGGDASVRASMVRHRATIVAQGTLIPAVLESALDSTRAGPVRALVGRDVRGYDGSRVLVPRGSRLFGDYRADLQPGQNRALITWTRLVRPDGVTIAIGSPAADTLGRIGVRGKVNSHFIERFGAAILQSSLEVGVNLASRLSSGNSPVVVALPGTTQALTQPLTQRAPIQPTLRVPQGTSISVFVARDLDFTTVESRK